MTPSTKTERVLVIDPGERVGFATAWIVDGQIESPICGVSPLKDFAVKLYSAAPEYNVLVYETWRLRPDVARKMIGNDFQPVQLIGVIRLMGWVHGVRLKSLGPNVKATGAKVMPDDLTALKNEQTEEHPKDALDLLSYYWWDRYV